MRTVAAFGDSDCKGAQGTFWVREMVCTLTGVVVTQMYPFVKRHCTERLKRVHFIMCKLYLNK